MRRVLIVQLSSNRDGSAFSGLMLADGLREAGWDTHVVFGFDGPMVERYAENGHQTRVHSHKNWLRGSGYRSLVRGVSGEVLSSIGMRRLMDELRPAVVYVNTGAGLAGILAARRAGVPSIWHLRELFADEGGEMSSPAGMQWLLRRSFRELPTAVACNSEAVARSLLGSARNVRIIANAVEERFFDENRTREESRRVFDLPQDRLIVGVPGTLRPMKGHRFFFRAAARMAGQAPNPLFAITGGGEAAFVEPLKQEVEAMGISEQVRFLGSITDMPAFYRACDVVCIPSESEPFGRTVIEAMAAGSPLVATAVGGIRETVRAGETGLLVSYDDVPALVNALQRLLCSPEERDRLRATARREASARFAPAAYKRAVCELVESVAGGAA
ncbi:MAG TPA: glycosyltransferase family 4 protein [Rhodothermales bacterium]